MVVGQGSILNVLIHDDRGGVARRVSSKVFSLETHDGKASNPPKCVVRCVLKSFVGTCIHVLRCK